MTTKTTRARFSRWFAGRGPGRASGVAALLACALLALAVSAAAQAPPPFSPYDDFSSGILDRNKWYGSFSNGSVTSGHAIRSVVREVYNPPPEQYPYGGVLSLGLHVASYGNNNNINNNLHFPDSLPITRIDAGAMITEKGFQHGGSFARMRIQMALYNVGGGTPGDATGDVRAQIFIRADSTALGIYYQVFKCMDSGCSVPNSISLIGPEKVGPDINLNEGHSLGLSWDGATLKFYVDDPNTEVASLTTANGLPAIVNAAPNVKARFLGSTIRIEGVGGEAWVSGGFDNVQVDQGLGGGLELYDDFNGTTCAPPSCGTSESSGPRLNPAKWGKAPGSDALELVRVSRDGKLRARTAFTGTGNLMFRNRLFPINQVATTGLQATAALHYLTSSNAQVNTRILQIHAFNDGTSSSLTDATGDIFGLIRINSSNGAAPQAQFQVQRCTDSSCAGTTVVKTVTIGPVTFGLAYVYSLRWVPESQVFEYQFYQEATTPPAPSVYNPATDPNSVIPNPAYKNPVGLNKELRLAHLNVDPGSTGTGYGYIDVEIDDVKLNPDAAYVPGLATSYQTQVTGDVVSAGVGLLGAGGGTINLAGIPGGATVVQAFLYATILGDWDPQTIPTLDGVPLGNAVTIGRSDTPTPNTGYREAFVVRADVTSQVQTKGNGSYVLAGFPTGSGGDAGFDALGASLVVVYNDGGPGRVITINDGGVTLMGNRAQAFETQMDGFNAADPTTGTKLTFVVGGGTTDTPEYGGINQAIAFNSSFAGADSITPAWDTQTADVSASLLPGSTAASAALSTGNNPLVWVAAVLSVPGTSTSGGLYPLSVMDDGSGDGLITSNPPGINCGGQPDVCTYSFAGGTPVTLTATANPGSIFTGWSGGGCSGTGTCTVTMDAAKTVTATFDAGGGGTQYDIVVTVMGTGTGTVTSSPGTINCPENCVSMYDPNTVVTLTATPTGDSTFAGWGEDCSSFGTNPVCQITVTWWMGATATFNAPGGGTTYPLGVIVNGGGSVVSTPLGIDCGATCSANFPENAVVNLLPMPSAGYIFAGWSGDPDCSDGIVTMTGSRSCTATFNLTGGGGPFPLTVTKSGSGSVSSDPTGLNCVGNVCTGEFSGLVTLTATADMNWAFAGWGGACQGAPGTQCTVTMDAAKTVTVAFAGPGAEPAGLYYYDRFGGTDISPGRWVGVRENTREIRDGELALIHGASVGADAFSNVSLNHANPPTDLNSLQAHLRLGSYLPPSGGWVRLRMRGAFYNDGYGGGGATGSTGDVWAQILMYGYAAGARIQYYLWRCNDATCATMTDLERGVLVPLANANQTYAVGIAWNGSQFTFTVDGVTTVLTPTMAPPATTTPRVGHVMLRSEIYGGPNGGSGYAPGFFDNVYVNGTLYDDFAGIAHPAGPRIDRTKWANGDMVREIMTGALHMESYAPLGGSAPENVLAIQNAGAVNTVAVDVTVTAASFDTATAWGQTGIQGRYFNKGTGTQAGDVYASVAAFAASSGVNLAFQAWHNDGGWTVLATHTFLAGQPLGQTYRLFLKWDEMSQVFVYGYGSEVWTFDPKPFVTVASPPTSHYRGLYSSVGSFPDSHAFIAATFDNVATNLDPYLVVGRIGTGSGTITSNDTFIACGSDCNQFYPVGGSPAEVTLTATPDTGSTFTGWTGACTGTDPCLLTMSEARGVRATFTKDTFGLTVSKAGTGTGTVTSSSSPAVPSNLVQLNCGSRCSVDFTTGTVVTLTATPDAGSTFTGWAGGGCSGTGTCTVTMDAVQTVTATFDLSGGGGTYALTVSRAGTADGTITSDPPGITCPGDCTEAYAAGTSVDLFAYSDAYSQFTGWSGDCAGTGLCTVAMNQARNVTANFLGVGSPVQQRTLTVNKFGSGIVGGTIGIDCGLDKTTCTAQLNDGSVVRLVASPADGYTFTGWGNACFGSGTGPCTVTMNADLTADANFSPIGGGPSQAKLTVYPNGSGMGTVTSDVGGITCPNSTCSATFDPAASIVVTLTATPSGGSTFLGWVGEGCTGTGTCTVTMSQSRAVVAIFEQNDATGFTQADLAGTWILRMTGDGTQNNSPQWSKAEIVLSADGTVTGGWYLESGETTPTSITQGRFLMDKGGLFAGTAGPAEGMTLFPYGKLDPTKRTFGLVEAGDAGTWVGIGVGTKAGGTFQQSDLAGTWSVYLYDDDPISNGPEWAKIVVSIDAAGVVQPAGSSFVNSKGQGGPLTGGSFTINPSDGTFTGTVTAAEGGLSFDGKLSQSKTHFGAVEPTAPQQGDMRGLVVGIKHDGSFTQADLAGTWHLLYFADGLTANDPTWAAIQLTVDPSGAITGGNYIAADGEIGSIQGGGTLTIDANGIVTGTLVPQAGYVLDIRHAKLDQGKFILTGVVNEPATDTTDVGMLIGIKAGAATAAPTPAQIGFFRAGAWSFDQNGNHILDPCGTDACVTWGQPGDLPVVGDWNGDGTATVGIFRDGTWYLDVNGNGAWDPGIDRVVVWGQAGDRPVVGDWNGDGTAKVGVFRNGAWYLDVNGNGAWDAGIDQAHVWGQAGDLPVVGDWDGDGRDTIGIFRNGAWYLDVNGNGAWDNGIDQALLWGQAGDTPIVGDWNGTGTGKVGVVRNGTWYLDANGSGLWEWGVDLTVNYGGEAGDIYVVRAGPPATPQPPPAAPATVGVFREGNWYVDKNGNGGWDPGTDLALVWGLPGDIPVVGDWDGDGKVSTGNFRDGTWYLDVNGNGLWDPGIDRVVVWGQAGDLPVVGDWNGDGTDTVGIFRNGAWYLDANGNGAWDNGIDQALLWGQAGDTPIVGDWNGDGTDTVGIFRAGNWYLDVNGNGLWDPGIDRVVVWGQAGDLPVVGDWNGDGTDTVGIFRAGNWYLDVNGNGVWDPGIDLAVTWGQAGDTPVVGKW